MNTKHEDLIPAGREYLEHVRLAEDGHFAMAQVRV